MQRIYFCTGTSFLTGDELAGALIEYAWALAQHRRHDLVRLPTMTLDGTPGASTLLMGPESQISAEDVGTEFAEVLDAELASNLRERTAQLRDPLPGTSFEEETDDRRDLPESFERDLPESFEVGTSWDGRS
jgi:hypothetical protein